MRRSPVVKCVTNDIRVPADAEMVLEGYFDARGHVEAEGPYGEFLGYYGGVKKNPVFHLTAITRRRDALFQTATIGGRAMSRTDTALLGAVRTEVIDLAGAGDRGARAGRGLRHDVERRQLQRPRRAAPARARRGAQRHRGRASARSPTSRTCSWSIPTSTSSPTSRWTGRWRRASSPTATSIVLSGMRTLPLDPSLTQRPGRRQGGLRPHLAVRHRQRGSRRAVPEPPRFEGKRFASVAAALADGPKYFEELMTAVGSRDGREIVRELEALRARNALDRDGEGRYMVRAAGNP